MSRFVLDAFGRGPLAEPEPWVRDGDEGRNGLRLDATVPAVQADPGVERPPKASIATTGGSLADPRAEFGPSGGVTTSGAVEPRQTEPQAERLQ